MKKFSNLCLAAAMPVWIVACATAQEIVDEVELVNLDGQQASEPFDAGNGAGGAGGSPLPAAGGSGTSNGAAGAPMGNGGGIGGSQQVLADAGVSIGGAGGASMIVGRDAAVGSGAAGGAQPPPQDAGGEGNGAVEPPPPPPPPPPPQTSVFDPAACDFDDDTGCESLGCVNFGEMSARCSNIEQCVVDNSECITEEDPLCGQRNLGQPSTCTSEVEMGGGGSTPPNEPASLVLEWVECMCQTGRL